MPEAWLLDMRYSCLRVAETQKLILVAHGPHHSLQFAFAALFLQTSRLLSNIFM